MAQLLLVLVLLACAKAQEPLDRDGVVMGPARPREEPPPVTELRADPDDDPRSIRVFLYQNEAGGVRLDLSMGGRWGPEEVERLVMAPEATAIRRLDLSGKAIGPQGGMAIAASPKLKRLEGLVLADTGLGEAGIRGLAYSEGMPRLVELSLAGTGLEEDGLEALRGARLLQTLVSLDLSRSAIPAEKIAQVLLSVETPQLKRLVLDPGVSPETVARWKERGVEIVAP